MPEEIVIVVSLNGLERSLIREAVAHYVDSVDEDDDTMNQLRQAADRLINKVRDEQ